MMQLTESLKFNQSIDWMSPSQNVTLTGLSNGENGPHRCIPFRGPIRAVRLQV